MKLPDMSGLALAALVAGATAIGGIFSAWADARWLDAGAAHQANVQLVELAIGILSAPAEDAGPGDRELREWAVETINAAAQVRFDEQAQAMLVTGSSRLLTVRGKTFPRELPNPSESRSRLAEEVLRELMGEAAEPSEDAQPDRDSPAR